MARDSLFRPSALPLCILAHRTFSTARYGARSRLASASKYRIRDDSKMVRVEAGYIKMLVGLVATSGSPTGILDSDYASC